MSDVEYPAREKLVMLRCMVGGIYYTGVYKGAKTVSVSDAKRWVAGMRNTHPKALAWHEPIQATSGDRNESI